MLGSAMSRIVLERSKISSVTSLKRCGASTTTKSNIELRMSITIATARRHAVDAIELLGLAQHIDAALVFS
jgi:hypothetical protein